MRRVLAAMVAALVLATACGGLAPTAAIALAPSEPRLESSTVDSAALEREMPYIVSFPRGYDTDPARRYPVLYLLHGMDGSERQWVDIGIPTVADRLMTSHDIPPFIVVMPEGEGGYWMDQVNGPRWGTYVTSDLVTTVDARYRTIARPEARAIGGLSMGAHGALQLSMNHPDLFRIVGAHSPALRRENEAMPYFGKGRDFQQRDPVSLMTAHPDVAKRFAIWVDIGQEDKWATGAEAFHQQLVRLGIPHEWRESAGDHVSAYWSEHLPQYLRFYGAAFGAVRN